MELFDGHGLVGRGPIRSVAKDHLVVALDSLVRTREPVVRTVLLCALLKAQAMDSVLRKATELGVTSIVVASTEHSVPAGDPSRAEHRISRWERILSESCLQCGRPIPPSVSFFEHWAEALERTAGLVEPTARRALLHPETEHSLGDMAGMAGPSMASDSDRSGDAVRPEGRLLAIAVGPEGGFSTGEVELAQGLGWEPAGLGPLVLRAETAAVVAATFLAQASGRFVSTNREGVS